MKWLVCLAGLYLIPGSALMCWHGLLLIVHNRELLLPLAIGMGSGIVLYLLLIRRSHVLSTFSHELSHAVAALMFFRKITKFRARGRSGGMVSHSEGFGGGLGNMFIMLAPYFLPVITLIAVLARPFVPAVYIFYVDIFIGFAFINYLFSSLSETRRNWFGGTFRDVEGNTAQTDIRKAGFVTSLITILSLSLFMNGLLFFLLVKGYGGFLPYLKLVVTGSYTFYLPWVLRVVNVVRQFFA
ncbi:MAG: M50 family metallopeptidase [Bacteroidetes bacterium]|nr:M50 family metallopeptidase [Bacteroidota bacterium]